MITDTGNPVIIATALYGTRMAHIFIRVCALIYNGVLPSTFARHLGHQYLPQTAEVIPRLLTPPRTSASMQSPPSIGANARPRLLGPCGMRMERAH